MKSKLFLLFGSFGPKEWKPFEDFLASSTGKSVPDQLKLFFLVKERCLAPSLEVPGREDLARLVWPDRKVSVQAVRYLESDLVRSVEQWWVRQELKQHPLQYKLLLLQAYAGRSLQKPFDALLKDAESLLQRSPARDLDFLFLRYQLNALAFEMGSRRENRGVDPRLQGILDDLEELFHVGSLKYGSIAVNLGNVTSSEVDAGQVDKLLRIGEEAVEKDYPGARVYVQVLRTLVEPEEEDHFGELLVQLRGAGATFSQEERGQLYAFALNYCIKKLNEGRESYLQMLFELYQSLLEQRIIFSGPYILQQHFKNIVTTAIRLGEFAWTEDFLEAYLQFVPPKDRQNASNYNRAALYFARKKYSPALRLLQEVEFSDIYYHVDSKALLLKTYFELEEWEALLSLTKAFDTYLRRNVMISPYQRKVYRNFLKYTQRLARLKMKGREMQADLLHDLETAREVADLRWLKLKADRW